MRGTRAGLTGDELLRCQNLLEDPVNDEVGVAADGTRKVAVRRSTEGVVPLVGGFVEGTLHGAKKQCVGNLARACALCMRKRSPHGSLVARLDPAGPGAVNHTELV